MIKVAFQGAIGAYSEIAAHHYFGEKIQISPSFTFIDVFKKIKNNQCQFGIVPIENSLYGSVYETFDFLLEFKFKIVEELFLQINHNLISTKKYNLNEIERVYSHPQALGQCSTFLQKLKNAKILPSFDTAGSVTHLQDLNCPTAVVASRRAAEIHKLKILQTNIQNHQENFTRFLVVSKKGSDKKILNPKSSISFELSNIPGALFKALSVFALRDINLLKIESRPILAKPFEYRFFVDLQGDLKEFKIKNAMKHLSEISDDIRLFGTYEKGNLFNS